ncbi:MAG: AAA family ATPase [Dehalococcoidales bacterium]|jgi:DNA helicase-2/ATP-dependent DNA helicase PcrA|nr:AAA family ATPase [Dehalococcoidales bacterium]MDP6221898.1 UvrD-helicase domain-containing protein [Dehalococcoidales bacterium]MDP7109865.1 UvrD-helicase domain-containing protein [Dehalococcoidales bacterium]MDP7310274.1 UvrD-helicase domain-containing protein [Dehalococcoidales bacterium]MDP7409266.1 UvrD-helicase domain-containing protein [Dehalococcoidales bacterium]
MDILAELNHAQREAVEAIDGPVLILAGPGSGKTRVITHRIAYLIRVCGVSPYHVMAVTFTNKAAREMVERLGQLVNYAVKDLTIGTFHALCSRILRREGEAIGIDARFVIYDAADQISLLKHSLQELNLDPKQYTPAALSSAISSAKNNLLSPDDYRQRGRSYFDEIAARVYERYQQRLRESGALDFDDLLMMTVLLFRQNPEVLSRYQLLYRHLLVDEFQDTNLVQYALIKQIGDKHRNICVVGDPDQSIYSWRFADLRNILSFENDYPDTKIILLEQNYRSTKVILETASQVISVSQSRYHRGKLKQLWTNNEAGELVTVVETYTEQEEAQFVVSEIERLVSHGQCSLGDCAVMYRTNAQSRAIEEAFIRYGMPYRLVAGTRFYERREVKDIIAYLRLIQNCRDSVSLLRVINVPPRGIGEQSQTRLLVWAKSLGMSPYEALRLLAKETPFSPPITKALAAFYDMLEKLIERSQELSLVDLFDFVIGRIDYKGYIFNVPDGEERWDNILELRSVAQEYHGLSPSEGLTAFLEGAALVSDIDNMEEGASAATLITLHKAKGLEFPVVFIVGMEDGLLPHSRSIDDPTQMEEERRLFYVGVTRAKKKIYLARAVRRNLMGRSMITVPSRFLNDIPRDRIAPMLSGWQEEKSPVEASLSSWSKSSIYSTDVRYSYSQNRISPIPSITLCNLKVGDRVRHSQFGEGVVVSCQSVKDDMEATIAFDGQGVKKLLLSFARLEKV